MDDFLARRENVNVHGSAMPTHTLAKACCILPIARISEFRISPQSYRERSCVSSFPFSVPYQCFLQLAMEKDFHPFCLTLHHTFFEIFSFLKIGQRVSLCKRRSRSLYNCTCNRVFCVHTKLFGLLRSCTVRYGERHVCVLVYVQCC